MTDATTQEDVPRARIARRIHDLLLHELGENIDIGLLLGPPMYARAVLSLCRTCGSQELTQLGHEFERMSAAELAARSA